MTFSVKNFYSAQSGASPCAGTAGYGISILDACLVTGFNSKNVSSITVTANVATLTTATAHGFVVDEIILIAGANEAVFNTEFKVVSVPTSTTMTFAVTTATTPATGTITVKMAPLGWAKVYSGTNKAVYRSADVTGTRLYLRVDDSTTTYATVAMYETMSNVDTGTGKSADLYWPKSDAASTAARPWYLIGDSKRFYFLPCYLSITVASIGGAFGDLNSLKAGDAYHTMLIGPTSSTVFYNTSRFASVMEATSTSGQLLARAYTQLGGTVNFYKRGPFPAFAEMGYATGLPAINPGDNGIHLTSLLVIEAGSTNLRGTMPGLYAPLETVTGVFAARDASLILGGKTYLAFPTMGYSSTNSPYCGCVWFDAVGPW